MNTQTLTHIAGNIYTDETFDQLVQIAVSEVDSRLPEEVSRGISTLDGICVPLWAVISWLLQENFFQLRASRIEIRNGRIIYYQVTGEDWTVCTYVPLTNQFEDWLSEKGLETIVSILHCIGRNSGYKDSTYSIILSSLHQAAKRLLVLPIDN